jgi:isorenieratene synthase
MTSDMTRIDVTAAFDHGAPVYDRLVGRNPGYHEHLRISARRLGIPGDGEGLRLLDIGCGTGASTAALLRAAPRAEIVAADASAEMLARARAKRWPPTVRFVHAPVEDLASAGVHGPFDGILAAYLVRNLAGPDEQLRALYALLRPGATLAVHEYVAGSTAAARAKWNAVCCGIVIPLAAVSGGGAGLYRHLRRSVASFDTAPEFGRRLERAGFDAVRAEGMPGWQSGIEYTFLATRPDGAAPVRVTTAAEAQSPPGRDRRALAVPAATGHPSTAHLARRPVVVVVGGGIAGVTAAVALAERGVAVRLLERHDDLGGRLRGWPTTADGVPATMSRGFHAFFRQYYNLRSLLRRVDPALGFLRPVADYPLVHSNGTTESFSSLPRTPPWNIAGFVLRSKTFAVSDLRRMNLPRAATLFDISVPRSYAELDEVDAATFLRDIGFPPAARHLAFEVFSRSFFAHPAALSAAELAAMFHIYFLGSSEGLLFDVPAGPFSDTLWRPLRDHLARHDAEVRTSTGVRRVDRTAEGYAVETTGGTVHADAVVLATDSAALRRLVADSPDLGDPRWRGRIDAVRTAPPFLVSRLWLDRPARADRAPFLGTSGFSRLDNISVLDAFDDEARAWRARTGGSVVELHAYALPDEPRDTSLAHLVDEMRAVYPELRDARIRHEEHVLEADCPLFAPGTFHTRPTVATTDPTLVLAGDLVRVDLPVALMERAATTGFLAANALLRHWDIRGHDLWSVANQGRSALLRRAARRSRAQRGVRAQRDPVAEQHDDVQREQPQPQRGD